MLMNFNKDKFVKRQIIDVKVPVEDLKRYNIITIKDGKKLVQYIYIEKSRIVDNSFLYNSKKLYAMPGIYFFDFVIFGYFYGKSRIKVSF